MKLLFPATCLFVVGCGGSVELHLGRDQLQPVVETIFPIDVDDYIEEPLPVEVTLHSPDIWLSESSNRLSITSGVKVAKSEEVAANKPSQLPGPPAGLPTLKLPESGEANGKVTVSSELHYDPDQYCFYVRDVTIDEIDFDGPKPPNDELIRKGIASALNRLLAKTPV